MESGAKYGKLCKEKMVEELISRAQRSPNFVITNYAGSTVSDMERLRGNLKKSSGQYIVVKNSILRIVFEKLKLQAEAAKIEGGMGISFAGDDIIAVCKDLVAFGKENTRFKIKGAIIEGKSVTEGKVRHLAGLPAKQVLLAIVVGGIKSPITGFVNTLGGILRKFVYVVDAIKRAK
jgi:large subunit ribosomal protein L10